MHEAGLCQGVQCTHSLVPSIAITRQISMGNIALCRYSSQSRLRALSSSPTRMEQVQNTVAWHQSSLPDRENAMLLPCHDQLIIMKGLTRPCCPDLPLVLTMCLQWGARIQASAWCCTQPCVVEPLPASLWPPSMLHAVPTRDLKDMMGQGDQQLQAFCHAAGPRQSAPMDCLTTRPSRCSTYRHL